MPYLAAHDRARAALFNSALENPEIEALFCARGGYGSVRILSQLDQVRFQKRNLPLVGFSDITALHGWASRANVVSIHGPVITQLGDLGEPDIQGLFALLESHTVSQIQGLTPLFNTSVNLVDGALWVANLSVLCHLVGTPYFPNLRRSILMLEEINEAPYRIDRLLSQLRLSGALDEVRAIILGDFLGCDAMQGVPPSPLSYRDVLRDCLFPLSIPVLEGAPIGHGSRNRALPIGVTCRLDIRQGTLSL